MAIESDPLLSPCQCRLHVKCGERYLSVIGIRSNDYRSLVTCMCGNFVLAGHTVAVDHIIGSRSQNSFGQ